MKSEKIKVKLQSPAPGYHLGAASTSATKTGKTGKFHPLDCKPLSIIDETVNFWTKRTGKKISHQEAEESIANITNFFRVVGEWDYKTSKADFKPPKEF